MHLAKILNKLNIKFIIAGKFSNQNTKEKIYHLKMLNFIGLIQEKQNLVWKVLQAVAHFFQLNITN